MQAAVFAAGQESLSWPEAALGLGFFAMVTILGWAFFR